MPGKDVPTQIDKARLHEIADLIKELPAPSTDTDHNSITLGLAEEIFGAMPKSHAKRCRMIDQTILSKQLVELAAMCRDEGRPGHVGPVKATKRSFERKSLQRSWPW